MTCTVTPSPSMDTNVWFDVTVNDGQDYLLGLGVFQLFQPALVVDVSPTLVSAAGNSLVDVHAVGLGTTAFSLVCRFTYMSTAGQGLGLSPGSAQGQGLGPVQWIDVPITRRTSTHGTCVSPPLPLNPADAPWPTPHPSATTSTTSSSTTSTSSSSGSSTLLPTNPHTLSIVQNHQVIYGPLALTLHLPPQLTAINPRAVVSGVPALVTLTFALPIHPDIINIAALRVLVVLGVVLVASL